MHANVGRRRIRDPSPQRGVTRLEQRRCVPRSLCRHASPDPRAWTIARAARFLTHTCGCRSGTLRQVAPRIIAPSNLLHLQAAVLATGCYTGVVVFDFLHTAERMLATPSVTGEGTAEIVRYLCQTVVPHLPGDGMVLAEPDGRDANLLVVIPGREGTPALLLNSHLDTVPPGDARSWVATGMNPYRPRRDGDRLIGLGSADAKLDWLCKAEAVRRCAGERLSRPIQLLGTFGEERGLIGARRFLERAVVPRAGAALVGEPTECQLVTQHKGLLVAELQLEAEPQRVPAAVGLTSRTRRYKGQAAHSATPQYGDNAILKSLNDIADETPVIAIRGGDAANKVAAWCEVEVATTRRRRSQAVDRLIKAELRPMSPALLAAARDFTAAVQPLAEQEGKDNPAFAPPGLTVNIGRIAGRGNTLAITFDLRCLPGTDREALRKCLHAMAEALQERYAGVKAVMVIKRDNAPLASAPAFLVQNALTAMTRAGLPRAVSTKAGCTEAGLYASAGIPSVVFGAGMAAGNIHAPNEWTSVTQLRQAVGFYVAFIRAYCGG